MKKRAPPGEANCVVVRHTASDGSKGLHLRAIATMAPGTQLTITSRVGAKIFMLRPLYSVPRRFEEPSEAKADPMDVDDDNRVAPMLVDGRVRACSSSPARPHVGAGRPVGSTPLRVRTAFFFEAVMFPLHCYPHIVLLLPRVSFPSLPPALIRSCSRDTPTMIS